MMPPSLVLAAALILVALPVTRGQSGLASVGFTTLAARDHVLEESPDLVKWTPVGAPVRGNGGQWSVSLPLAGASAFYRVRLLSAYTFDRLSVRKAPDLRDLESAYQPGSWRTTALEVLRRTIPDAAWIVEADTDPGFFGFWFGGNPATFGELVMKLSSAVHETVHHLGFQRIGFQNGGFVYSLALGSNTFYSAAALSLFPRSEIIPALPAELRSLGYVETYLRGQSGTQEIINLLDELNAYTFTVLVDAATVESMTGLGRRSTRDGVLAMMLFLQAYLKVARTEHPADYQRILGSPVAELVVVLWDRAEQALAFAGEDPRLGIQDEEIRRHVMNPERMAEIDQVRAIVVPQVRITR